MIGIGDARQERGQRIIIFKRAGVRSKILAMHVDTRFQRQRKGIAQAQVCL